MTDKVTYEYVAQVLNYDKETGVFTWKKTTGRRAKSGKRAGCRTTGYEFIGINKKLYLAHRLAWLLTYGNWPKDFIDHINGNSLDNRISNLRDVPCSLNLQNQRHAQRRSKSGLLGVSFHKARQLWRAQIAVNFKTIHIGYFNTPEAAHEAYMAKKREVHVACSI